MRCPGFDLAEQPLKRPRDRGEKTVFLLPAAKRRRLPRRRCCVYLPRLQSTEQEEHDEEQGPLMLFLATPEPRPQLVHQPRFKVDWTHGTELHYFLPRRFSDPVPLLQETCRTRDGAGYRRTALRHAG